MGRTKVQNKKFILTANLYGLTEEETLTKENDMIKAQIDNSTIVPGLNPTAASVQAKLVAITDPNTGFIPQLTAVRAQEKALVSKINKGIAAIKDIIVSEWMPQAQSALASDAAQVDKAHLLQFGIKNVTGGKAETTSAEEMARNATSAPVIVKIDTDVKDEHILHIHNNITGKRGHGKDVLRVDMYAQYGGTLPINFAALLANGGQLLGTAERGVYINPIITTTANKNTVVYYIAVYISKKTKKPVAYSIVAHETIK